MQKVRLIQISTNDMTADILTKGLAQQPFAKHLIGLGLSTTPRSSESVGTVSMLCADGGMGDSGKPRSGIDAVGRPLVY